jgi:hypothetical protein
VSVAFFDASEVLMLLLSCPKLNKDECSLFNDAKNPFVALPWADCPMLAISTQIVVKERHTKLW